jgi:LmbE family N-acetylglucosaminyl deacetylase
MKRTATPFRVVRLAVVVLVSCVSAIAHPPKVLLVVAHPDDEYNFAATTYRIARELGGTVDEVVITNGEGGYRYSSLAEKIYGLQLTREEVGRSHLPAIRKQESLRAGRILGIRRHYFLNQKDQQFTVDAEAANGAWNVRLVSVFLDHLLAREHYDFVFALLPTEETHGHHQAATLLALQAVARLPENERPASLGAEAANHDEQAARFAGRSQYELTRTAADTPAFIFDRRTTFGFHDALNYGIVVNWLVAEYKSQGLFQTDIGKHDQERFWLFALGGSRAISAVSKLSEELAPQTQAARRGAGHE